MRIVFMGTPAFACKPLESLCSSEHELVAVVTGIDKASGRGKKVQPTAVCDAAIRADIPVIKAGSLKDPQLYEQLAELKADLFVVIAFRILPQKLIDLPRLGAINIHGSLLPKYRGAAPVNWAIINGEKETGLTSFFLKKTVDTGDLILQEKLSILDGENFDSLYNRLSQIAGPFLLKTLDLVKQGAPRQNQDDSQATPAPKLTAFDGLVDFGLPALNVVNFIRGLSTKPAAYTYFRGKKLKLIETRIALPQPEGLITSLRPGTLLTEKKRLMVKTADLAVELIRVIPQGKKEMDGLAFKNGVQPKTDELLGEIAQGVKENL